MEHSLTTKFSEASESKIDWKKWLEIAAMAIPVLLDLAAKLLPLILAASPQEKKDGGLKASAEPAPAMTLA